MRFVPLVLLAVLLRAADNDPFAAYHYAIEQQLAAISDRASEPPRASTLVQQPGAPAARTVPPAGLRAALARLERYRPALESILGQEGIPKCLLAVVLVESGAQPLALSPKQARGLWQFIPDTARQYGLTVTADKDERVHTEMATRAAARYLRDLHTRFGDWELALAAYNAGPDAVERAMQRGRASTYRQLSAARLLPEETRKYVPAVMSAMDVLGMQGMENAARQKQTQAAKVVYAPAGIVD